VSRPGVDLTRRTSVRPGAAAGYDDDSDAHGPPAAVALWTQSFGGQRYRVVAVPRAGGGEVRIGRSLAETERVLSSLRNRSMLVGLVIIVLAAAAGVLIARRTTRSVTQLSAAADEVAATGRLNIAVPAGGRDEIGRLARAFSSMLAALTRSRDQQQRLVQDAGHELRTPLTSLRANIDTLRRHPDLAPAPRDHLLADLDSELRELSALVDELVALAVERHDDEPEQTGALDQLVERAAERARLRPLPPRGGRAQPARVRARPGDRPPDRRGRRRQRPRRQPPRRRRGLHGRAAGGRRGAAARGFLTTSRTAHEAALPGVTSMSPALKAVRLGARNASDVRTGTTRGARGAATRTT
jgi:signal transduction histidine kinase